MPLIFNSGNGGTFVSGIINLPITKWTCKLGNRTTENTHSGTGGFTNYEHVVVDAEWSCEGAVDEDNLPDTDAGLTTGKGTLTFKNGADARTIVLTNTTIVDVTYVCDNTGDIVRFTASGKGGVVTRFAT